MPKRAASSSGTPSPKQPRVDGPSPATAPAARPHGRVVLDVGGTRFVSSRSTLERASTYFRALLTRWDDDGDEPLFIDCDADAFQILLSYMRIGALTLPQHDEALCIRVLLHAEYLGLEALLEEVKVKAHANMHPDGTEGDEHQPKQHKAGETGPETAVFPQTRRVIMRFRWEGGHLVLRWASRFRVPDVFFFWKKNFRGY